MCFVLCGFYYTLKQIGTPISSHVKVGVKVGVEWESFNLTVMKNEKTSKPQVEDLMASTVEEVELPVESSHKSAEPEKSLKVKKPKAQDTSQASGSNNSTSEEPDKSLKENESRACMTSHVSNPTCSEQISMSSCAANVLVCELDKCYRRTGVRVMLEWSALKQWALVIKYDDLVLYSCKPGKSTLSWKVNLFNQAIRWTGFPSNNWTLEFTSDEEWIIFKQLHDNCVSRNSASAIPVPRVRVVSDYDRDRVLLLHSGDDSTPSDGKYITTVEDEIHMALNRTVVNYDADSEDEKLVRNLNNKYGNEDGLSIEIFEHMIDKFERLAYRGTEVSDSMATGIFPNTARNIVIDVYHYWNKKGTKKGTKKKGTKKMALISVFKPRPAKKATKTYEPVYPVNEVVRKARSVRPSAKQRKAYSAVKSGGFTSDGLTGLEVILLSPVREQQHEEEVSVRDVGRKVTALMICGDYMEDYEVMVPFQTLQAFGVQVDCVSPNKNSGDKCPTAVHDDNIAYQLYTEFPGHSFTLNAAFTGVVPQSYDALIIPGGRFAESISCDDKVLDIVSKFADTGKPIATTSHSQLILVSAGVIKGKTCTGFPSLELLVKLAGGFWLDPSVTPCTLDQNIISAIGWHAHADFLSVLLRSMGAKISGVQRKAVLFLCGDQVEEYELNVPFQALRGLGFRVHAVSPSKKKGDYCATVIHDPEGGQVCSEKQGHKFLLNADFSNVSVEDYDCLVIPGGRSPEFLVTDAEAVSLVKGFGENNKVVSAIGYGKWLLAAAGLLKGKNCASCNNAMNVVVKLAGGKLVEPAGSVIDEMLLTATGWSALPAFIRDLINLLGVRVVF